MKRQRGSIEIIAIVVVLAMAPSAVGIGSHT